MRRMILMPLFFMAFTLASENARAGEAANLIEDPSFELSKEKDQFGLVFAKWSGWKYEGDCDFRVGQVARTGKQSCLLAGGTGAKIRITQNAELAPGRYRITAYLRGLDIGVGKWNTSTEFMFDEKYLPLPRSGTFGWTKLTYVGEIKSKKKAGPSFGLMATGYFWIDDVSLVKVADDTALTENPVLDKEEAPLQPPGELLASAVRCPECGYRNMPEWKRCYACGTLLELNKSAPVAGAPVKMIASFEDKNPFGGGTVVEEHATDGTKALRLDKSYADMDGAQNWSGYDFLKADLYTPAKEPIQFYVEIRDSASKDYWTRVNYQTVIPPGQSVFVLPINHLYVGEKSRPGRALMLDTIARLVFSIGDNPHGPLFIDNIRLERDDSARSNIFPGLHAFDLGTNSSPVMDGFTQITPGTLYSKGRGYGLKNARIWRAMDALQPDPLYEDFICIESGGLALDVPNGKYHVFVNMDSPSGFWGEYQVYKKRAILAQGKEVVSESMDFESFKKKYYRFWNVEDLPADNTFDKYQKTYFNEKKFDVEVTNGQLNIDFQGEGWACSVSAIVIYPAEKTAEGEKFLKYAEEKRRFYFDNYFKRILHESSGDPLQPTEEDTKRGYLIFERDFMKEIFYNDRPFKEEIRKALKAEAFAGEYEPVTIAILPLQEMGQITAACGDLSEPGNGKIASSAIDIGYVSYRISRVTGEGSVYTISPRFIMPSNVVEMPRGIARRFWLTVKVPPDTPPGMYTGKVTIKPEHGAITEVPLEFTVHNGTLDPVDVPAGPWSYTIRSPWPEDEPAVSEYNRQLSLKSLLKLREYGFTSLSGLPILTYNGFKDGKPLIDYSVGDAQMKMAKEAGFTMPIINYCSFSGLDLYYQSTDQMKAAGFNDYSEFVKAIFTDVQKHADANAWLPVYWNLGDEPLGDDIKRSITNAEAYAKAFPKGPPFFTADTSFAGKDTTSDHFIFSKALHVADWNDHDEDSIKLLHEAGRDWAFYNGGDRWTYGIYLYKAAKQFNMKYRLAWHWNAVAGDPYYALDCREDDYAWCNATPDGRLVPSVEFEQLREGLYDYRYMLTLARLAKEKAGTPAAKAAEELLATRLASFKLGQRNHDALFGPEDWNVFRRKMTEAIEALRKQ